MKKTVFLFSALLAVIILTGASCAFQPTASQPTQNDGGIYLSTDLGTTWQQKIVFPTAAGVANLGQVNVAKMQFDPLDSKTIYVIAEQGGLFVTYDGANTWQQTRGLTGRVNDLAINPKFNCLIYASQGNKILKSQDCARSFKVTYFDTRIEQTITALAVDYFNPEVVYAGMTTGDFLKSVDGGVSWTKIYNFGSVVKKLLLSDTDSKIIYGLTGKGLYKTSDAGTVWQNLSDLTSQYAGSKEVTDVFFNPSENDSLFSLSKFGLLKTTDGGQTWTKVELLTPAGGVTILSAAVSPKNSQEIYYATASTFYKTPDGGANWVAQKSPTTRGATSLMFDPNNDKLLYLGTKFLAKK
ncbi:MAG: YCF48-related protein [Candidatus Buchananbacteria bacterium]